MTARTCSVGDCAKPMFARGMCHRHYDRVRLTGSTDPRPCGFCGGAMKQGDSTTFHSRCEPSLCFCEQPVLGGDFGTCKRCARPIFDVIRGSGARGAARLAVNCETTNPMREAS